MITPYELSLDRTIRHGSGVQRILPRLEEMGGWLTGSGANPKGRSLANFRSAASLVAVVASVACSPHALRQAPPTPHERCNAVV